MGEASSGIVETWTMRVGRVRTAAGFRRVVVGAVEVVDFVGAGEDVAVVERVIAPMPLAAADYVP